MKRKSLLILMMVMMLVVTSIFVMAACETREQDTPNPDDGNTPSPEAHEHVFGEWSLVKLPTETTEGSIKRKCTKEGCTHEESFVLPKIADGNYTATVVTAPTCQVEGKTKLAIKNEKVEYSFEITVPKVEHTCVDTVVEPTCTEQGYTLHTCSVCGDSYKDNYVEPLGHSYETKFDANNHWEECSTCHQKMSMAAHSFGEWFIVKLTSCTEEGVEKRVCACGYEETRPIPRINHIKTDWKSDGVHHWKECTMCGTKFYEAEHSFVQNYDDKHHWMECKTCGYKKDILVHDIDDVTYQCHHCGYVDSTMGTDGLLYDANADGETCSVVGYNGIDTDIHIPSFYEGMKVTGMKAGAFASKGGIQSIVIPSGITNIPATAFQYCSSLTTVVMPSGIRSIGNNAFEGCSSLYEIEIPSGVTSIGSSAFASCSILSSIVIPSGVTNIGTSAFSDCMGLQSVSLPDSIRNIGAMAFQNCSGLPTLVLPANVASIGQMAFQYCTSLTNINIPNNVTSIAPMTFQGCSSLLEINLPNKIRSIGNNAFEGCQSLKDVTIPNTVTSIGNSSFKDCNTFSSIVVPEGVTSVGSNAFSGCNGVTRLTIPASVTSIGTYAFDGCTSLDYANVSTLALSNLPFESVTTLIVNGGNKIVDSVFENSTKLTTLTIEQGVREIGARAFANITSLDEINIYNENIIVGVDAFKGSANVKILDIPTTLIDKIEHLSITDLNINSGSSIDYRDFADHTSLNSINIGETVTSIDSTAFNGCNNIYIITVDELNTKYYAKNDTIMEHGTGLLVMGLADSIIPDETTEISVYAFKDMGNIIDINIPASVQSIGTDAFAGSTITSASLGSAVIGDIDKTSLESVTIVGDVAVPDNAFVGCTALHNVTLMPTIPSVSNTAFSGCTLTNITMPTHLMTSVPQDNMTDLTINGGTTIDDTMFVLSDTLKNITLGSSITTILPGAFMNCADIASLTVDIDNPIYYSEGNAVIETNTKELVVGCKNTVIPNDVISIGPAAFCTKISMIDIAIPDNVKRIGEGAFLGCLLLKSITLPSNVEFIDNGILAGCEMLETVNLAPTNANYYIVDNCIVERTSDRLLSVTKTAVIPEGIKIIGTYSCDLFTEVTSITVPDSVETIEEYAFEGCSSLSTVNIGSGIKNIAAKAFNGCPSINTLEILSENVTIDTTAFENCVDIKTMNIPAMAIDVIPHSNVTNVTIHSGTTISADAFANCTGIVDLTLPSTITTIGTNAFATPITRLYVNDMAAWLNIDFADANANPMTRANYIYLDGSIMRDVVIPEGTITIKSNAFTNASVFTGRLVIPESVTEIAPDAFTSFTNISGLVAPSRLLEQIPYGSKLESISITSGTELPLGAFANMSSLRNVTLPDTMFDLDSSVFEGSINIANYTGQSSAFANIPKTNIISVTFIGETIGANALGMTTLNTLNIASTVNNIDLHAFDGCNTINNINIDSANAVYSGNGNAITKKTGNVLMIGFANTVIPNDTIVIGDRAFKNKPITSVTIPSSVTTIGVDAFSGCTSINEVKTDNIDSWLNIDFVNELANPTYYARNLKVNDVILDTLNITSATVMKNNTLLNLDGLTTINIDSNVVGLNANAFNGCNNIATVTMPTAVAANVPKTALTTVTLNGGTELSDGAFSGVTTLTNITLNGELVTIGANALKSTGITSITIPSSVTTIGVDAFSGCISINEVKTDNLDSWLNIDFANELANPTYYARNLKVNDVILDTLNITSATIMKNNTLLNLDGLTTINIDSDVAIINDLAFNGCNNIATATMPTAVVMSVPKTALATVTLNGGTMLPEGAFNGLTKLTRITLNSDLVTIGANALNGTGITSITIPSSVTTIGADAFSGAINLARVDVDSQTTWCAIDFGNEFSNPTYYKHNLYIGGVKVDNVLAIDSNVAVVKDYAFYDMDAITTITIPANAIVSANAFNGCDNISTATMPISTIEAMSNLGIREVNIGAGDTLSTNAFANYNELQQLHIPATVTTISGCIFSSTSLLVVLADAPSKPSTWNVDWNKYNNPVIWDAQNNDTASDGKKYMILDDKIYVSAKPSEASLFRVSSSVQGEVVLSDTINYKGTSYSVKGIEANAFNGCIGVTAVTIPSSITSIGYQAFAGCSSLTSVTIPSSVTSIGGWAFRGCSSLTIYSEAASKPDGWYSDWNPDNRPVYWNVKSLGKSTEYEYILHNDNTATLVKYIGNNTTVDNPGQIEGMNVTSIGTKAFQNCSSITSVVIPSSVTSIGESAFAGCSSLTLITIPSSVISIGYAAFDGCSSLTSITIPYCPTHIGDIFDGYDSNNYKNNIPLSLKEIIITSGTSIGSSAFSGCSSLTSVTIPENVTSIGNSAFSGCSSLNRVDIQDIAAWFNISFDNARANPLYYAHNLYLNNELATNIEIPSGVTSINNFAFFGCSSLASITIPDSVISIGYSAFSDCSSLTSITIPDSVTSIGDYAFYNCSSITSITIPAGVTSIGETAFYGCSSLNRVDITDIAAWCSISFGNAYANPLYYAHNLYLNGELVTNLEIPSAVTSINDLAFYDCSSLINIVIPNSVTSIGSYAFSNCSSLTIYAEAASKPSGWNSNWNYSNRPIEWNFKSLGKSADYEYISYNDNTVKITKYIGNNTTVDIPSRIECASVTSIDDSAFQNCSSLTSITISNSVTNIGNYAFSGCSSLTSVTIPSSVTSIGSNAFDGCSLLTIYVEAASKPSGWNSQWNYSDRPVVWNFKSIGKSADYEYILYNDNTIKITKYIGNNTMVDIPSQIESASVTSIDDSAFQNCSSLTSITIPESVTGIGNYAFSGCSSLTSIVIPNSVTSIGDYAYSDCSSLTSIAIPSSVISIGKYAFYSCTGLNRVDIADIAAWCNISFGDAYANPLSYAHNLYLNGELATNIEIPSGVTSTGDYAFYNCSSLTSIKFAENSKLTSIGYGAFYGCSALTSITIPSGVTSIGWYAFRDCNLLESITLPYCPRYIGYIFNGTTTDSYGDYYVNIIPSSLREIIIKGGSSIGCSAFRNCNSLTSITIPSSVTSIGETAFQGCSSLTSIIIPSSVTSIGYRAFNGDPLTFYVEAPSQPVSWSSYWNYDNRPVVWGYNNITSDANYDYVVHDSQVYLTKYKGSETNIIIPQQINGMDVVDLGLAFNSNVKITSITIPSSITSIGGYAFSGCSSVTSITIPNSVTNIGNYAFSGCSSLTDITIPSSAYIGEYAFQKCSSLTSITLPYCPYHIGNIFDGYDSSYKVNSIPSSLTEIILTGGTSIDEFAFSGCSSLTSVTIPSSVTRIGEYAFYYCSSLTIYAEAASKPAGWNNKWKSNNIPVVWNCKNNEVADDGYIYVIDNGIRYALKDGEAMFAAQPRNIAGDIVIPSSITHKGTLYSVISIGGSAFYGCSSLTSVTFGENSKLTSIGEKAFSFCGSLTSITIPRSVTSIGQYAFSDCSSLTSVTIPSSVTSIGEYAFQKCSSLTSITLPYCPTHIGDIFDGYSNYTNNIPSSLKEIVITGGSRIGESAFSNCRSFASITISASVTSIGDYSFNNCTSLENVIFETNSLCSSFGFAAFQSCQLLKNIIIPANVTNIGGNTFTGCNSLVIYTEATFKPSGWYSSWNSSDRPVAWGYDGLEQTYTFETNGGVEIAPITAKDIVELPTPTKEGHVFIGWYDNAECTGSPVAQMYYKKGGATLYAKWLTEEEYYNGSSFDRAKTIENGMTQKVNITTGGQEVYYKFVAPETRSYTIARSGGDTMAYLYDSNRSQLTSQDSESFTYNLTAGQTYYIAVSWWNSSNTGSFNLTIS